MTTIRSADGTRLNVRIDGIEHGPTVLLAHSVGCDLSLWDAQIPALAGWCRVVRYDARGHGGSDAPAGDYSIDQMGADALAVLDAADARTAHVVGLSLGGTLAQWLALHARDRLASMVLCDTAARLGTDTGWQSRIDMALSQGMAAMADLSMTRFFSDGFRTRSPEVVARFRQGFVATAAHGYAGCCAVLRDCDFRAGLDRMDVPTLVIGGREDAPTPPADAESLARGIPGAALVLLETGHLSAVEDPDGFNGALLRHLSAQAGVRR